jgi:hypothetical protein
MPASFVALFASLLVFGPWAAFAFKSITFSAIEQCGPFNVSFSGGDPPSAMPMTLTIVPLNSTEVISIPIPTSDWNDATETGAAITFLPLAAGTQFVASLDDANGRSTGAISDVIQVQPSSNSSCVAPLVATETLPFTIPSSVSQCEDYTVALHANSSVPTVRAFLPRFFALRLNQTGEATATSVSFTMDIFRGLSAVFLVEDEEGHRQSTSLLAVDGDTSSPTACLPKHNPTPTTAAEATSPKKTSG